MVRYLLEEHQKLANMPDKERGETPLFYALSKHKDSQTRTSLAKIFLEFE